MIKLFIDNKAVQVPEGTTVLAAARKLDIFIPVLCAMQGYRHSGSCMICLVEDKKTGKLFPSCARRAEDGMNIITDSKKVTEARQEIAGLLLAEHRGDCEAPCRRGCPVDIDIPVMLRHLAKESEQEALKTVLAATPFPGVLGALCSAPCQRVCVRRHKDSAVSIKEIHQYLGNSLNKIRLDVSTSNKKTVAVVGAGPAGLTAARYLSLQGYTVTLFEKNTEPGGGLLECIKQNKIPEKIVKQETDAILSQNIIWKPGKEIKFEALQAMQSKYHAVLLACGFINSETAKSMLPFDKKGIQITEDKRVSGFKNMFACSSITRYTEQTVRGCADGKHAAEAIHSFLGNTVTSRYDSHLGRLTKEEFSVFSKNAEKTKQTVPVNKKNGYIKNEAVSEAHRCLSCDCIKKESCELRAVADRYVSKKHVYHLEAKTRFDKIGTHPQIIYEPGKCIKCGRCVQITEAKKEFLGLIFIGRGFTVEIGVPLDDTLEKALTHTAAECVASCPTAALSWKR